MAVVKFSKQTIEPNPLEVDYWVDITSDPYGSVWKYYNGVDWVSLNLNNGSNDDLSSFDYYTKEQINSLLSGKADVDSVESKVDDAEFANVIQNIEFREIGDNQMEMVLLKYDNATVGVTIPMASETNPGMLSGESFRDFVKQSQLQSLYDELYQIMSDLSLAEKERNDAEQLRNTSENERISAETNRFNAENTRQFEEANRVTNESNRITAENNRTTAEGNRESTFNTLKGQMQTIIQEGQTAVAATEKATSDAQKVVDNYDTKVAEQDDKLSELDSEVNSQTNEIKTFKEAVTNQVNNYKPVEINGDVINAADEEDLTSDENNLLKLKNRNNLNGMGYIILRNNNTFAEQLTQSNTIYEIRYEFDLKGTIVILPNECTLKFVGGRLRNGTLKGENLKICHATTSSILVDIVFDCNVVDSNFFFTNFGAVSGINRVEEDYTYKDVSERIFTYHSVDENSVYSANTTASSALSNSSNVCMSFNGEFLCSNKMLHVVDAKNLRLENGTISFEVRLTNCVQSIITNIRNIGLHSMHNFPTASTDESDTTSFVPTRDKFADIGLNGNAFTILGLNTNNVVVENCYAEMHNNGVTVGLNGNYANNTTIVNCSFDHIFYQPIGTHGDSILAKDIKANYCLQAIDFSTGSTNCRASNIKATNCISGPKQETDKGELSHNCIYEELDIEISEPWKFNGASKYVFLVRSDNLENTYKTIVKNSRFRVNGNSEESYNASVIFAACVGSVVFENCDFDINHKYNQNFLNQTSYRANVHFNRCKIKIHFIKGRIFNMSDIYISDSEFNISDDGMATWADGSNIYISDSKFNIGANCKLYDIQNPDYKIKAVNTEFNFSEVNSSNNIMLGNLEIDNCIIRGYWQQYTSNNGSKTEIKNSIFDCPSNILFLLNSDAVIINNNIFKGVTSYTIYNPESTTMHENTVISNNIYDFPSNTRYSNKKDILKSCVKNETFTNFIKDYPSPLVGDSRPSLNNTLQGYQFFDVTLNKPIWWTGSAWVDATGVVV